MTGRFVDSGYVSPTGHTHQKSSSEGLRNPTGDTFSEENIKHKGLTQ